MRKRRALFSTWDKNGIVDFARSLVERGWEILSTSGTAKTLSESGVCVTEVADLTGFPPILGGRVKTLHPSIMGGILARREIPKDLEDLERHHILPIDLVVCNLYPFEESARKGEELDELIEKIDIGGVTLLRAAAKNFRHVAVVTDPSDFPPLLEELDATGDFSMETKERLALAAFALTCRYDATIEEGLSEALGKSRDPLEEDQTLALKSTFPLRYGENPHQRASLYLPPLKEIPWKQLSGKELSYNNILDLDAVLRASALFQDACACTIVKHTTPCGLAVGASPTEAYEAAWACDPLSAYGSVLGFTRPIDSETAERLASHFIEVLVAPEYAPEALALLTEKRPGLRLLVWQGGRISPLQWVSTWSGFLVQEDALPPLPSKEKGRWIGMPRFDLWDDLVFAWKAAALSKSNAIVIAARGATVGIGSGFTSRVDAVRFAVAQAGEKARGSVLASDAFFPFPDSIELAAEAGIAAIIQPGGSKKDEEVFAAVEKAGLSMFVGGSRTFRH